MWLTKDDDGTICLHAEFPKKIIVNEYVSYSSPNMMLLDKCNINIENSPVEVDFKIL